MSRYANAILKRVDTTLKLYGLNKPEYNDNKEPRIFPYGHDQQTMNDVFKHLLTNYDDYMMFLSDYKETILAIEDTIYNLKVDIQHAYYNGSAWVVPDLQSTRAILANAATKMYYIRTAARRWRREVNQLLNDDYPENAYYNE